MLTSWHDKKRGKKVKKEEAGDEKTFQTHGTVCYDCCRNVCAGKRNRDINTIVIEAGEEFGSITVKIKKDGTLVAAATEAVIDEIEVPVDTELPAEDEIMAFEDKKEEVSDDIYDIEETGMERPMKLGKKPVSPVFLDGILWIVMLKIDKFRHKSAKHIA